MKEKQSGSEGKLPIFIQRIVTTNLVLNITGSVAKPSLRSVCEFISFKRRREWGEVLKCSMKFVRREGVFRKHVVAGCKKGSGYQNPIIFSLLNILKME